MRIEKYLVHFRCPGCAWAGEIKADPEVPMWMSPTYLGTTGIYCPHCGKYYIEYQIGSSTLKEAAKEIIDKMQELFKKLG